MIKEILCSVGQTVDDIIKAVTGIGTMPTPPAYIPQSGNGACASCNDEYNSLSMTSQRYMNNNTYYDGTRYN